MRNLLSYLPTSALLLLCSAAIVACGSDDKDQGQDEPEILSVTPSSISLVSSANSSATFMITASGDWTINGGDDWLNISSTSGRGNTTITVTALTENSSASNRSCVLTINGSSVSATVGITQLAALKSGCNVSVTDKVILTDGFALKLHFGSNASYYYSGYLSSSSAGWTDARIIQELQSNTTPKEAKDGIISHTEGLDGNTNYNQYFVAFDEQGNRGELLRYPIHTPSSRNAPAAYISDVTCDQYYWYWATTINATASEYYLIGSDGMNAIELYYDYTPALIAMSIKDNLSDYTSYIQSADNWKMLKEGSPLYLATWAKKGADWSPVVNVYYGYGDSDDTYAAKAKNKTKQTPAISIIYPDEYENTRRKIKIKRF